MAPKIAPYQYGDDATVDTSCEEGIVVCEQTKTRNIFNHRKRKDSRNRLTKISAKYDLDGDGKLDEAEQAMRDMDTTDRGYLTNKEIKEIVQLQLRSEKDKHRLSKVIAALLCFIGILALSNLGTSFASAVLAKDAAADDETSTLRGTKTGELVGAQTAGNTYEFEEMPEDIRRERRAMVLRELEKDPHGAHNHRKLKKRGPRCKEQDTLCDGKLMFDNGMMPEEQFYSIQQSCERKKTVNIKRKFDDGSIRSDCVCSPNSSIVVKPRKSNSVGKKKRNKKKNDRETDREVIVITDGEEWFFDCVDDNCFTSGAGSLSGELGPCNLRFGDDDCRENLVCTNLGNTRSSKTGTCLYPLTNALDVDVVIDSGNDEAIIGSSFRGDGAICVFDHGYNACSYGYYCTQPNGDRFRGQGRGICRAIPKKQVEGQVCFQGHKNRACISGYSCQSLQSSGNRISGSSVALNGICEADFVDYDADYSTGIVISKRREKYQSCDVTYGENSCVAGYHCYSENFSSSFEETTGICISIQNGMRDGEYCDFDLGVNACTSGYTCQSRAGTRYVTYGICNIDTKIAVPDEGDWWVDWESMQCVRDCNRGRAPNCGGLKPAWDPKLYGNAQSCCESHFSWKRIEDCVPKWPIL